MVNTAAKPPMAQSAEDVYIVTHSQALELLQRIEGAMFDLPAPDDETPINWTHVGTVAELKRQLTEALVFVSGREN